MPDYDFRSLSPIDFEVLVRDLLQEELGVRLESFRSGRDLGIDFRYSAGTGHGTIVQCKHYADSTFAKLLSDLKNRELPKIERLRPSRYIIGTSLGLTPNQKEQILESLTPYLLIRDDIFGRDDLNNLLQRFPSIERQTFKLWISSVPILEEILHSRVKNASRDELEKIREHAKFYVQNESFAQAMRILKSSNLCVIAGIPGIGKTILAEMLVLYLVDLGYEIVKITGDIGEAIGLDHTNAKRIFYYDDFLGQTSLSVKLNKNEDQRLLDFFDTIRRSKKSKLILTTREYILNQARFLYEKLERTSFQSETCVVELSKYTRVNRAKILYNHLYFSDAPAEFKARMLRERAYLRIIDHQNYNPRIVDLMTQRARVMQVSAEKYVDFFIDNLKNPSEIWRHAFDSDLSLAARNTLIVLASLPAEVFLEDLDDAFVSLQNWLARTHGLATTPSDFRRSLKELDGNFISTTRSKDRIIVRFHNPSVRDFIENYLASNRRELEALLNSAYFFEQLAGLWGPEAADGVHQSYRLTVSNALVGFMASIKRTIDSRDCRLITVQEPGELGHKDIWPTSYELRASFVVGIASVFRRQDTNALLDSTLLTIQERAKSGAADRDDLLALLKTLKQLSLWSAEREQALLANAKTRLMTNLYWPQDFLLLCQFIEEFPGSISQVDLEMTRAEFRQFIGEPRLRDATDPEEVRGDASVIEEVAAILEIDAGEDIGQLYGLADYLEEEQQSEEPDDPDYNDGEYWPSSRNEPASDSDIDSLFSTLDL